MDFGLQRRTYNCFLFPPLLVFLVTRLLPSSNGAAGSAGKGKGNKVDAQRYSPVCASFCHASKAARRGGGLCAGSSSRKPEARGSILKESCHFLVPQASILCCV